MNNNVKVSENKKSIFKGTVSMGFASFLSRILGVVRVRLESTVLGGGEIASAWFLAFAIPNLLRRVLGEGALSNALIPLIAETNVKDGTARVRKQLAVVFSVLSGILLVIILLVSFLSIIVVKYSSSWGIDFFTQPRIILTFKLLPLLMPYGLFICLAGIVGAILHYAKEFLLPSLAALLLNIGLLGGLSAAWYWSMPDEQFLPMLALLVPAAGVLQLLMVAIVLGKAGLFPDFRRFWQERSILGKLFKLALPGICGYAALQVSFIIDRIMAASLGDQAIPALTYIDRIVDIPIGIVAVSLGNVLMSTMSHSAAEKKYEEIADTLAFGLRMIWFVTLPMAAMVIFFHTNMLHVLCLGGRYTMSDLYAAQLVAIFYGVGIPFFCSLKAIYPAFHSRKKMMTVLKVSIAAIVINIIMNYILMQFLSQGGIALSTVISSLFNNSVLLWLLKKENMTRNSGAVALSFARNALVAFGIAFGIFVFNRCSGFEMWAAKHWGNELILLGTAGVVVLAGYIGGTMVLGSSEIKEIFSLLRRRK